MVIVDMCVRCAENLLLYIGGVWFKLVKALLIANFVSIFCKVIAILLNIYSVVTIIILFVLPSSPQDTVIAMQALGRFSEATYSKQLNKTITFDIQGLTAEPLTITEDNRFERNEFKVQKLHSSWNVFFVPCMHY